MKTKTKRCFIISTVIISVASMAYIDTIIQPPYLQKSLLKIVLFLIVPMVYFMVYKDQMKLLKKLFFFQKKPLIKAFVLGVCVYVGIILAYFLFSDFIDLASIKESLSLSMGVNADNFIFVALYISLINSLLEEFFFRGYAFVILKQHVKKRYAYLFSATIFAIYHIGMTQGWFALYIYILSMLGLLVGGLIFNYLNDRWDSIYPSWLVHMFANLAINTVGLVMFNII